MAFIYPDARRADDRDTYHGTVVADPYRWLEDPDSEETKHFVDAQNDLTTPHLHGLAHRDGLLARMTELWDTPRTDPPTVRQGVAIWTHNDGLADQPTFYISRDDGEPEVLLDPNALSDDGAVAVVLSSLSPDGAHFAYALSEAGSDRQRLYIRDTATGDDLADTLEHLRFTSVAWFRDGFFYTRWPETEPGSTAPVTDPSVHYHRIGDPQSADPLIFHNDDDPDPGYLPTMTENDRYLVVVEYLGTSDKTGLLYLDTEGLDLTAAPHRWTRLVDQGEALHAVVHQTETGLIVHTDRDAPTGAIVHIPFDDPDNPTTIVAEGGSTIEWAAALAGELIVVRLVDASHTIERYSLTGDRLGSIDLPGPGSVEGLFGRFEDPDIYISYQSFLEPPQALRWNDGAMMLHAGAEPPIDPASMIVERRTATSSDGAEVGMFVIRHGDATLPGPVELYGYGGFSINLTPSYSPARLAFLEAGGVVVVANLRGGVEQGDQWHTDGMLGNKQQVFDDFIACGEQLIADGITTAEQLGIRGGSNGGLLTAATMIQRPDLFGAVVSQVPVTDMLRYQHFTAGRFWTVEYGDAADPEAFRWLLDYSPLHNVEPGVDYPPLLITTAESDDRVVPMHAYKLAATAQWAAGGASDRPLLLRVDTRAGHGMGKPTAKVIEEAADIYSFLLHHLAR